MKNFLFLLILIPCAIFAQSTTEYGSFKIQNTEIIYQKVFVQDSITSENLAKFLKSLPVVSNVEIVGDGVQADLTDFTVDFKKFQFAQVATPTLIQTGKYSGKVKIDGKAGKYRVTIKSMQVKGDAGYKKITSPDNLSNYATVNSGTTLNKDWLKPNTLGLLDKALTDLFTFKEVDGADW
jgi:hypothetical protein